MANTLTEVLPKLLAQGLLALRQQSIMPRLINRDYETLAAQKGASINIPIPSAIAIQPVAAAATPPATADIAPTSAVITLDQWWEAPFYLTDRDIMEAMDGVIPMQASEAVKSVANKIDSTILALYTGVYGYAGVFNAAGATATNPTAGPLVSDVSDYTTARTILNKQLAPMDDRRVLLDPDAEGNALGLRAFQDASFGGGDGVILRGQIGSKMGADWFMSQNVPVHTSTLPTAGAMTVNGVHAVGATTVSIAKITNATPLVAGDILQFAGDPNTYVVVTGVSVIVGNTAVIIRPGLKVAKAGGEVVSLAASHTVNMLFHRDFAAFASRPLADQIDGLGNTIVSTVDPISGVALRLEMSREHKRTRFSYDCLWGCGIVRAELATRLV